MPTSLRTFRIGRDAGCDLVLDDHSVSRRHAEIFYGASGAIEINDMESSGGTILLRDGKEETVRHAVLQSSDVVRFGRVEMTYSDLASHMEKLSLPLPLSFAHPPGKKPPLRPLAHMPQRAVVASRPTKAILGTPTPGIRMERCACGGYKKKGGVCPACGQ